MRLITTGRTGWYIVLWSLFFIPVLSAFGQVTGISYTLSPIGSRINWDDNAGLRDGYFYGGQVGFGFGEFVELSGVYTLGYDLKTDFSELSVGSLVSGASPGTFDGRDVDARRYGANLRLNLSRGSLVPFVKVGTGIIRFEPDGLEETESIYALGGAGLTFSLADRYTLSVAAENLSYRFNPASIFSGDELTRAGLERSDFTQKTLYNPALSASLKLYLGGRGEGDLTEVDRALMRQFRGGGFQLAVEPFAGQIHFDEKLGFPKYQSVAGVNAGFDLGPYIGLRGFYWRGLEQEKLLKDELTTDFTELALYGGELDLRFSGRSGGISPFLRIGGGYVTSGSDYTEYSGFDPDDRYFAMGGGGIELPLSSSLTLQGGIRVLLMTNQDIETVSDPSSVYSAVMYSAGLRFNLGGGGRTAGDVLESERAYTRSREQELTDEMNRLRARIDSLEYARAMRAEQRPARITKTVSGDSLQGDETVETVEISNLSGETVTIPVPERGEIYIRYGDVAPAEPEVMYAPPTVVTGGMAGWPGMIGMMPGDSMGMAGPSAAQIRQIVREAVAEQSRSGNTEVLNRRLRDIEDRLARLYDRTGGQDQVVVYEGDSAEAVRVEKTSNGFLGLGNREYMGLLPMAGFRFGDGPEQFLLGGRAEYRLPGSFFMFMPEGHLGFGDGLSINLFGNGIVPFSRYSDLRPYAGAGLGVVTNDWLSGLNLAFNLLGGVEYTLPNGINVFGEYSTLNLFDIHRFMGGVRLGF